MVYGLQPFWVQGQKPPEIPSRVQAWSRAVNWQSPRQIVLSVESRQGGDPATPDEIERDRARVMKILHTHKMPFAVVADREQAGLEVSLIIAPHVRYGMFHYQNAPYVYLLVRDTASRQLGYCAYRRLSRITNQTNALLTERRDTTVRWDLPTSDSLEECTAQAMMVLPCQHLRGMSNCFQAEAKWLLIDRRDGALLFARARLGCWQTSYLT
jgi:hypothetical protein